MLKRRLCLTRVCSAEQLKQSLSNDAKLRQLVQDAVGALRLPAGVVLVDGNRTTSFGSRALARCRQDCGARRVRKGLERAAAGTDHSAARAGKRGAPQVSAGRNAGNRVANAGRTGTGRQLLVIGTSKQEKWCGLMWCVWYLSVGAFPLVFTRFVPWTAARARLAATGRRRAAAVARRRVGQGAAQVDPPPVGQGARGAAGYVGRRVGAVWEPWERARGFSARVKSFPVPCEQRNRELSKRFILIKRMRNRSTELPPRDWQAAREHQRQRERGRPRRAHFTTRVCRLLMVLLWFF